MDNCYIISKLKIEIGLSLSLSLRDPPFTQDDIIALPRLRLAFELECCSSRDVCRLLSLERRGRGPPLFYFYAGKIAI